MKRFITELVVALTMLTCLVPNAPASPQYWWVTTLTYQGRMTHKRLHRRLHKGQTVHINGEIWSVAKIRCTK